MNDTLARIRKALVAAAGTAFAVFLTTLAQEITGQQLSVAQEAGLQEVAFHVGNLVVPGLGALASAAVGWLTWRIPNKAG